MAKLQDFNGIFFDTNAIAHKMKEYPVTRHHQTLHTIFIFIFYSQLHSQNAFWHIVEGDRER